MTSRRRCPPAPGPLETYAACFDAALTRLPQRRGFRDYLAGLLAPRERNKTLTALADTEQASATRRLPPSRSLLPNSWRRRGRPGSASGRWWPTASTATTRRSSPSWRRNGSGSSWRSNPSAAPGPPSRARPAPPMPPAHLAGPTRSTPAAGGGAPGGTRGFRDGHTETWWAADARLPEVGWEPRRRLRLVVATTDPARLPSLRGGVPPHRGRSRCAGYEAG